MSTTESKFTLPDLGHSDEMFLGELSGRIGELASAHIGTEKEYFPYDFVDEIDQAVADGELDLHSEEAQIDDATKQALFVNVLTEEGLQEYLSTIQRRLPSKHPLRDWSHYWSADEGRHGPTISSFIHKTKQFNMRELERARMAMLRQPETPQPASVIEGLIYPAIQEPATEKSHRNTMRRIPKAHKIGKRALGFVARDEVRHGTFYQEAAAAALEVEPSLTIIGIARQVQNFAMPGKSIPGFNERAKAISQADIFGPKHIKSIYDNFLTEKLKIWNIENLTPEAEAARHIIHKQLDRLARVIKRQERHASEATSEDQK